MGMGITFGFIAGMLMRLVYSFEAKEFYRDDIYFEGVPLPESEDFKNVNMDNTFGEQEMK